MKDKYLKALSELQVINFHSSADVESWKSQITTLITRIYGVDSKQIEKIEAIKFNKTRRYVINGESFGGKSNTKHCENLAKGILSGIINDIENFGLPIKENVKSNEGINISVNQSQEVNVTIEIIWNTLKNELTGNQFSEIESIVKGNDTEANKKEKILKKIKTFGSDVLSNIIAGILTNPAILG